jgi:hypothetical protein
MAKKIGEHAALTQKIADFLSQGGTIIDLTFFGEQTLR